MIGNDVNLSIYLFEVFIEVFIEAVGREHKKSKWNTKMSYTDSF